MPCQARSTTTHPDALREVEVLRVRDVTSGMRRVTLTGPQMKSHVTEEGLKQEPFVSTGFDDDFRLFFPRIGNGTPLPIVIIDGERDFSPDDRPLVRAYTVRRYDAALHELDVDFVSHGTGVASRWAKQVEPGARIHLAGPWSSRALPTGFDWWLVAGDETALPAIARLLDEAPETLHAQVVVEVAESSHRQELRELPGVEVTWVIRNGSLNGTYRLIDAVRSISWWGGTAFAWIAGEQSVVRDVRRHLLKDRAIEKDAIDFAGYWKREKASPGSR